MLLRKLVGFLMAQGVGMAKMRNLTASLSTLVSVGFSDL